LGQKVNPHGLRVGVIKDWSSRWYAKDRDFADLLVEDHKIREYIKKTQYSTGISKVEIERSANKITLYYLYGQARPYHRQGRQRHRRAQKANSETDRRQGNQHQHHGSQEH
jgi:hypothetical protein